MKSSILQNVKNNVLLVAEKAYPALSAKNFFNLSSVSIGKSLLPLMCRLNCVKVVPIFSATKLFFSPVLSSFSLTDKFLFFMPTKVWCKILFSKLFVKLIFQLYLCPEQTMKGMKIEFTDALRSTTLSISDDSLETDGEIMIEGFYDGNETWHTFRSLNEFDDFMEACEKMRQRLKTHLNG